MSLFRSLSYWRSVASAQPRFLIDGLVHSSATIVSGRPMSGKTTLVSHLVRAIAGGQSEVLGQTVHKHGPVLVACTDGGETTAWSLRLNESDLEHEVLVAPFEPVRLWDEVHDAIEKHEPALFVFDNVLGATPGDIRGNDTAHALLSRFNDVLATGTPVLAVAHSSARSFEDGKYPRGPMGSTAYDAWDRLTVHVESRGRDTIAVMAHGNESAPIELVVDVEMLPNMQSSYTLLGSSDAADKRPRKADTLDKRLDDAAAILNNEALRGVSSQRDVAVALGEGWNQSRVQRALALRRGRYDRELELWVPEEGVPSAA